MTRRADDFAQLKQLLATPTFEAAASSDSSRFHASLGEGDHLRPDASHFAVQWQDEPTDDRQPGWFWYDFQFDARHDTYSELRGPYSTSHAAYLAGYHYGADA